MVPGAPYAEDTEIRMRMRYAVLSGLSRVGFIPEDPEHIEFIQINTSDKYHIIKHHAVGMADTYGKRNEIRS